MKFGTAKGTCGPLRPAKFPANLLLVVTKTKTPIFVSHAAVQRRIFIKRCMKIEDVRTIFAPPWIFSIRSVVPELGDSEFCGGCPIAVFAYKFQFTNRIAPNVNSFCRPITRINLTNFIDIWEAVRHCGAKIFKILAIFRVFWGRKPPNFHG